jgi:AmmeMemoRadiSam system protein A
MEQEKEGNKSENLKPLLKLARDVIESKIYGREIYVNEEIKKKFSKKQSCFVTLSEENMLRGCIGSLYASQELWKDVVDNSIHAALHDYRFLPLKEKELDKIKIEISVLSIPEKLGKGEEVFDKIDNKMGIILEKAGSSSTFLPQVWEQIKDKKDFLEELSLKAGLFKDSWKTAKLSFYRVDKVKEK